MPISLLVIHVTPSRAMGPRPAVSASPEQPFLPDARTYRTWKLEDSSP